MGLAPIGGFGRFLAKVVAYNILDTEHGICNNRFKVWHATSRIIASGI
jgi:hypothetical protein